MAPITGPFGFWSFPFINFIFGLAESIKEGQELPKRKHESSGLNLRAENVERWNLIRDPISGRLEGLEVHREVKTD